MTQKILIVEDKIENRELLAATFDLTDYRLLFAIDGLQGLQAAQRYQPDLILLDIVLPKLNGLEVCRRLKADPLTAAITIILLSAKAQPEDIRLGLATGADGYVTKPFSPMALLRQAQARLNVLAAPVCVG